MEYINNQIKAMSGRYGEPTDTASYASNQITGVHVRWESIHGVQSVLFLVDKALQNDTIYINLFKRANWNGDGFIYVYSSKQKERQGRLIDGILLVFPYTPALVYNPLDHVSYQGIIITRQTFEEIRGALGGAIYAAQPTPALPHILVTDPLAIYTLLRPGEYIQVKPGIGIPDITYMQVVWNTI